MRNAHSLPPTPDRTVICGLEPPFEKSSEIRRSWLLRLAFDRPSLQVLNGFLLSSKSRWVEPLLTIRSAPM